MVQACVSTKTGRLPYSSPLAGNMYLVECQAVQESIRQTISDEACDSGVSVCDLRVVRYSYPFGTKLDEVDEIIVSTAETCLTVFLCP